MKLILAAGTLFVFLTFAATAPPTIYLGDSGEICAAAVSLGIGHPPGYPLYMLAAKIFSLLPAGDIAFRVNLLSAFLGSMVFLSFFFFSRRLSALIYKSTPARAVNAAAIAASLTFVFSYIFWFEAVNAKGGIYILSLLITLLAGFFCLKFYEGRKPASFLMAAYLTGFLPVIHHTTGAAFLFLTVFLVFNARFLSKGKITAAAGLYLAALFTPYAYLFIRAEAAPAVHWADITGMEKIIGHIMRKTYFTAEGGTINADIILFKLKHYAGRSIRNYHFLLLFMSAGALALYKSRPRLLYFTGALFALTTGLLIALTGHSMSPLNVYLNAGFYLSADLFPALLAAPGLLLLPAAASFKKRSLVLLGASAFLIVSAQFVLNNSINNHSRKFLGYDHIANIYRSLNPGDILFASEDAEVFGFMYFIRARGLFSSLTVYDKNGTYLDTSIYSEARKADVSIRFSGSVSAHMAAAARQRASALLQEKIELDIINSGRGRVFYSSFPEFRNKDYRALPYGPLFHAASKNLPSGASSAPLMRLVTLRDLSNNRYLDLYYRDVASRYYIQSAKISAVAFDPVNAAYYIHMAERLAHNIPSALNLISAVYFYDLKDVPAAISRMERIMELDPYNYSVLNALINMSLQPGSAKALQWLGYYYKIAPDAALKNRILLTIEKIREETQTPPAP